METLQNLLTIAIEVVTVAGFGGIALHAIWSSHCKWMTEYCPAIEPAVVESAVAEPMVEPMVEPIVESMVESMVEPIVESMVESMVEPIVESMVEPMVEPIVESMVEPIVESMVEPVVAKYEAMNVKRLRQECQVRCIDWRRGGDYGRVMRKNQMIRALTA